MITTARFARYAKLILATIAALCGILALSKSLRSEHSEYSLTTNVTRNLQTQSRVAIVALVSNSPQDLKDFCYAIQSLKNLANSHHLEAPIIAFHEGISTRQQDALRKCTNREIRYTLVSFDLPAGFDVAKELENSVTAQIAHIGEGNGRPKWGYVQMIRFWTSGVYKHPAVDGFDTIMRIDTDSCFKNAGGPLDSDLPSMPDQYVYRAIPIRRGSGPRTIDLYDFAVSYMWQEGISPQNPELWALIEDTWKNKGELATVQTNFEVSRLSFFRRADVAKWQDALTDHEPWGVFRHRWGDAQTRVLTLAMFSKSDEVLSTEHMGYVHGRDKFMENKPSYCCGIIGQLPEADLVEQS
eukprot:CAMPEP_0172496306 /NCGR_PEP_ID=MMETSP1066-20121228/84986_1 /TAXON_ID=671091 /ORGANISM="Coscinodiscus wailesii, Strain CCMP2513" /LENGTH=354 /DNA_ID=CAMNT_0013268529 /DNA_START=59 /DNA_END=1123 /DNA_ORIENTATION=-